MNPLPFFLPAVFLLIVLITAFALLRAAGFRPLAVAGVGAWLLVQGLLSATGFYTRFDTVPPRLLLLVLPPLAALLAAFGTRRGRAALDSLHAPTLTLLHTVRLPVEFVLWGLAAYKAIPALLTFEGSNFDILSGLSAPLVYLLVFLRKRMGRRALLLWNLCCLALLVNVVAHAFLSAPTVLQRISFDRPTRAIGYFPFTLLPGFVVPVVLTAHLVMLRRLWKPGQATLPLAGA